MNKRQARGYHDVAAIRQANINFVKHQHQSGVSEQNA